MTAEVVTYMAADKSRRRRVQFALVMQCAPFLKGMRTASMLSVEKDWVKELYGLIRATDISCRILAVKKERCLALFYRKRELQQMLAAQKVRSFLGDYGYADMEAERAIARLSVRMNRYLEGETAFPHEMGVFLGYPLEDVKAFIQNDGRGSLFTGYWKVYHDPARARLVFSAFDRARDSAVNEFLAGKDISEIARAGA